MNIVEIAFALFMPKLQNKMQLISLEAKKCTKFNVSHICIVLFLLATLPFAVHAQFDPIIRSKLHGNVFGISQDSTIALEAKLTLQSMPDGDEIFIVNSAGENGSYEVRLEKNVSYKMAVESKGFFPHLQTIMLSDKEELNVTLRPNKVGTSLRLNLNFELSKANLTEDMYTELEMILNMMTDYPTMKIQLEGHTDFRGNARANETLSKERVEAVRDWLIAKGITPHRIVLKFYGGAQPLSRENTEEARSMNRRVEVKIIEI